MIKSDESLDELSYGNIKILQKKKGYRFSLDALLLARFCKIKKGNRVIELGSGSGIIAQILARTTGLREIVGLEIQESMVDMAERSVKINNLTEKVRILHGDIRKVKELFSPGEFDIALFNPPYRRCGSGRINPRSEKAIARHEIAIQMEDSSKAIAYLLKPHGCIYLIYCAERLAELIVSLRNNMIEPKLLRFIYPKPNTQSDMVLLEGIKNGGTGLKVAPPLSIHKEDGFFTDEIKAMYHASSLSG